MTYPQKPDKRAEESPSSKRETDRLDTQQIALEKVAIHRRNPSQLLFQQRLRGMPNSGPKLLPRCSLQGTCSLLNPQNHPRGPVPETTEDPGELSDKSYFDASLRSQELFRLPRTFSATHFNLKSLDLRDNKFADVPPEIFGLATLHSLRLDGNLIRSLPPALAQMSHLRMLTASKNQIRRLDPSLGRLAELSVLVLSENLLNEWPAWLCRAFSRLTILHLHGNSAISSIPLTFSCMQQLGELSFDWFCYIDEVAGKTLKGTQGAQYIAETRGLCRAIQEDPGQKQSCSFTDFILHFSRGKPSTKYAKGRTALHLAAMWGHLGVAKELIGREDGSVNVRDCESATPLLVAIRHNRFDVVNALLDSSEVEVSANNAKYGTALHLSVLKGWWELCERLIAHPSLDPNAKDNNGNTVLHLLFAIFGQEPIIISKLCTSILNNPFTDVNTRNANNMTPLHYAAKKNQRQAIQFALEWNKSSAKAFNFGAKGGKQSFPVLHFLSVYADIELINEVLRSGVDIFQTDAVGRTARDLVRNSITGRLLLKYENVARKAYLRKVASSGTATGRECSGRLATCPDQEEGEVQSLRPDLRAVNINRAMLSPDKDAAAHAQHEADDLTDDNENEYNSPVQLAAYTTAGPLLFEDIHRMNCEDRDEFPRVQIRSSPMFEFNGNAEKEGDKPEEIDTERMSGGVFKRPSLAGDLRKEAPENAFSKTCKFNIVTQVSPDDRILTDNQFAELYQAIMNSTVSRATQYRYVYHIFRKYTYESEQILLLLLERLGERDFLKSEIAYLLGMLKSQKVRGLLSDSPPSLAPLHHELLNARPETRQRTNYLPIKYEAKQRRMETLRASLCRGNGFAQTQCLKGMASALVQSQGQNTDKKCVFRHIPSMSIRKTMNYFT